MTLRATILGCGSSAGVPRVAIGWGACDPANPKNRRRRCSLLVERIGIDGATRVLIDTSPDLREQLLAAAVDRIDAVLMTHAHADQCHGLDDLRPLVLHNRAPIPVYMTAEASADIRPRFAYCFETPPGSHYPPIVTEHRLVPGEPVTIMGKGGSIRVLPFCVHHGDAPTVGFRIDTLAYTPDVNGIPDESVSALEGLDVWIVDALRETRHPSHFSLSEALAWIARMKPARAVITNMTGDFDYEALAARLPAGVEPGYDGMMVRCVQPCSGG